MAADINENTVIAGMTVQHISSVISSLDAALNQPEAVVSVYVSAKRKTINERQCSTVSESVFKVMGTFEHN